jgi:hypothetical protein
MLGAPARPIASARGQVILKEREEAERCLRNRTGESPVPLRVTGSLQQTHPSVCDWLSLELATISLDKAPKGKISHLP